VGGAGEAGIKERKFIEWFRDHPHTDDLKILDWVDAHTNRTGFVDWYAFDHPQLGKVELGGWDQMYTWRNPPAHLMGVEAERNTRFAITLADLLPRLEVHLLTVNPLGDQTFSIRLVVENSGFLPTYTSEQGKKRKAIRPARVEIELPEGARLLHGKPRVELGHLEGRNNKLDPDGLWSASPTDNRAWTEWVVQGKPGSKLKLRIKSERAGSIEREVELL